VEILEPAPVLNLHWRVVHRYREILDAGTAVTLSAYGAAASSARARSAAPHADVGRASVSQPPLAVVDAGSLREQVTVTTGPRAAEAIAVEAAGLSGGLVVEAFEVAR
jgi:hypothetical protein